jgi:hypothetical protein
MSPYARLGRLTCPTAHLPFDRTFPPHYPQYLTKDDLAQGYLDWSKKYGIVSPRTRADVSCGLTKNKELLDVNHGRIWSMARGRTEVDVESTPTRGE